MVTMRIRMAPAPAYPPPGRPRAGARRAGSRVPTARGDDHDETGRPCDEGAPGDGGSSKPDTAVCTSTANSA